MKEKDGEKENGKKIKIIKNDIQSDFKKDAKLNKKQGSPAVYCSAVSPNIPWSLQPALTWSLTQPWEATAGFEPL